ncbi:hypothetical protein [Lysobacter sp. CA199]|uniref:hypothetical protein n=1 Tax=Lysobacter sp. CA199 TaxID=3455608 RepID=UPI003F8D5561
MIRSVSGEISARLAGCEREIEAEIRSIIDECATRGSGALDEPALAKIADACAVAMDSAYKTVVDVFRERSSGLAGQELRLLDAEARASLTGRLWSISHFPSACADRGEVEEMPELAAKRKFLLTKVHLALGSSGK